MTRIIQVTTAMVLILLAFSKNTFAQFTQTIRGTVVDQVVQSPVDGATVTLSGSGTSVITDAKGNFRINNVAVGLQTILITHTGYKESVVANIQVNAGKEVVLTINLVENVKSEKEIIIKGDRKKNKPLNDLSMVSARAFTVEETQRYPAAVNDPSRMATSFPGVMTTDDGNNNIVIRGNSPTGLLWKMEGVDIPNPNHFASTGSSGGGVSILSSQLLSNSDFITSAFAAEYGNALSGVFDLKLRKGNNEKREYTAQAGILGLNLAAEGPFKKGYGGSYLINYRYSTLSLLDKVGVAVGPAGSVTNFQDLSYNIYLPTKKLGKFSFFGFGGLSNQAMNPAKDTTKWEYEYERYKLDFVSNTGMSAVTHQVQVGTKTNIRSAIAYSYNLLKTDVKYLEKNYSLTHYYDDDYLTKKLTFSSVVNHKFNTKHSLRAGAIVTDINFNYLLHIREKAADPVKELINVKNRTQTIQGFAQWQYRITNDVTISGGMHYLNLLLNHTYALEPRASFKWDINKRSSLALGYGRHSQIQALGAYFAKVENGSGGYDYPNRNLGFTKANHYVVSYSYLLKKNLRLKAELYYQQLLNVPVSKFDTSTFSILNVQSEYITDPLVNKGTGRNYGLELSVEKYLSNNFYFMFGNSFYQSKYKALDGVERNTRFNGKYIGNLVTGKEFVTMNGRRSYGINIKATYAGGYWDTPVDLMRSRQDNGTVYKEQEAFTIQNPAYFRTDIRLSVKWNRKHLTSTLSLDVQNVTNRKNIYNRSYDRNSEKIVTNYQMGMLPILNYKVEF